jgi:predicted dehydrogenase
MTSPVRVGVLGVGYLGSIHARIYANMDDVDLVGVVDANVEQAEEVAEACNCKAFASATEMLGQVDAVSVVVPTSLHLEMAKPFIKAGVHVLMEKPIAPTYDESLELVEMAEQAGIVFQVGHLERFNAGVMELANRVKEPRFIEVHRVGPFVARATDVDVVTDLMIHDIDIVMSLVNSPLKSIYANGIPIITDHADIANARLEFENGAVASFVASRVSREPLRRIRIFEHKHYYNLDYVTQQIDIAVAEPPKEGEVWAEIVADKIDVEPVRPLDAELRAFVDTIRENGTPLVTGRIGLEAVRVANIIGEKIAQCQ